MTQTTVPPRLRFNCYGVTMELACEDAELMASAHDALPPGWSLAADDSAVGARFELAHEGDGARRPITLRVNGEVKASALRVAPVVEALEGELRMQLAGLATRHVFVHAGVVAWKGRAIVLPGASASGKTTLVHALLRAGASYGSDEYAVIDADGLVHPYARPLSIRQGRNLRVRADAAELADTPLMDHPLPLGLVVMTHYVPDALWNPSLVSPGEAVMGLFANTLAARDRPAEALSALSVATNFAIVLAGPRGEASICSSALLAYAGTLDSHSTE